MTEETRTQIALRNTTPIEAAHARGLKEGRVQGRARFWWLLERKNELGARYRNVVGRKRYLEVVLQEVLDAYVEEFGPDFSVPDWPEYRWQRAIEAVRTALNKGVPNAK